MKMRFWLTPGLLALSDFDSSTRMLLLWKAACCAQVSKSHLSIDHLSGAINYLLLNKIWQWEDILYVFCVFFFVCFYPPTAELKEGRILSDPFFLSMNFWMCHVLKWDSHDPPPPPRPPPRFNVRVELLVNSWVGGAGGGRGGAGTMACAVVCWSRWRERVLSMTEWKRLVSMLGNETRMGGGGGVLCLLAC